jgi:hypothetical protein
MTELMFNASQASTSNTVYPTGYVHYLANHGCINVSKTLSLVYIIYTMTMSRQTVSVQGYVTHMSQTG